VTAGRIVLPSKGRKKDYVHKAVQESGTWLKGVTATGTEEKVLTAQWCRIIATTEADRHMFLAMLGIQVSA
jgi:hypothetical protein